MVHITQLHHLCINPISICALMVHICFMTLLEFIRSTDYTFATFAAKIGETENIVRKWAYQQRQPSLPRAVKVQDATGGLVTAREQVILSAEAE
tara:strand:- start:19053 stop:19334 length:282 start_codon:yes stop_codon:yes gene_type:complete